MSDRPTYPTDSSRPTFDSKQQFQVAEGQRRIGLCFAGDASVSGYGDERALGWVGRVLARTPLDQVDIAAYNLGVLGATSADLLGRWRAECDPRWAGRNERRLVIGVGAHDPEAGLTTARSRLNLANMLDDAATHGMATFVVSPTPRANDAANEQLRAIVDAQADVCARRGVPFVDCFTPLLGHEQWEADLLVGDGRHPGRTGYGLVAWLVLNGGWARWMRLGG
ncbi:Lysophospholipase L1 [Kytococcus aerolatus]|uniref:Lysophospholipase L1 n=1 Tax=Kytococcus aerolatus TaxID=592308 RepID=A0A212T6I8_9MICO|nr:GDSL-type esterase/lipase family protein [Kytococcus aerolatus]SNC61652.1 Lysophospholipase L1 [Kytococcus aerolatus]